MSGRDLSRCCLFCKHFDVHTEQGCETCGYGGGSFVCYRKNLEGSSRSDFFDNAKDCDSFELADDMKDVVAPANPTQKDTEK